MNFPLNLNDFQLGNPGKYATADALTEANMADYQTSLVDEFTPYGIDRTNLYEDFADNRDLISETATSPQFNTSLINEFGVKDRGTFDANEGLQFGSIPATADQGFGLMNSDAAKAAAMSVMSNAFNENLMLSKPASIHFFTLSNDARAPLVVIYTLLIPKFFANLIYSSKFFVMKGSPVE